MKKKGKKGGFGTSGLRPSSASVSRSGQYLTMAGALVASAVAVPGTANAAQQGVQSVPRQGGIHRSVQQIDFDIPAGSLISTLQSFEAASSLKVSPKVSLEGIESRGVVGKFTPQQALHKILEGTGLTFVFAGKALVVIDTKKGIGDAVLAGVSVSGNSHKTTVSSAKYTEELKNIPQTVNIIPQELIKSQNITSLRDVVRNIPGITMNAGEGGNYPGDKFNVRGFTAQSDMFVDGVRDIGAYSRDIFNVEQVEVTKGPNSSISGRGSTGGAINMVTKSPRALTLRTANISVGSADQRRIALDANQSLAPIGYDGAAVRLNVVSSQGGVAGNEVIRHKNWGIAPSLAVGLNGPTQFNLGYSRAQQDNIPSYGLSTFNEVPTLDTRKFYGLRSVDFEDVGSSQLNARFNHSFGSVAQLQNQTIRGSSRVSRIVTPVNPVTGARSPKSHVFDNSIVSNQTNLNLSFRTGPIAHTVTTGVEYSYEKSKRGSIAMGTPAPAISDIDNPSADADFHPTLTKTYNRRVNSTSLAAYLFESFKVGKYVELNGGARWDSYDPEYVDSASLAGTARAKKSTAVSARGALVVHPSENGSVYASYGTSFNPSSENLTLDGLSAASSLDPEKSRTYEVGSKWDFFKQKLLATVAAFRTEKTNARTPDPDDPSVTILAAKQRVQGFEVGLVGEINSKVALSAGYSNLEGKTVSAPDTTRENQPFTNVPRHSINLWGTVKPTRNLSIGAGARYMDKRLLRKTATSTIHVPSYHTYDAVASYKFNPTVDIQLNIYNLSNKLFYDSGRMWVPAPGRSVTLGTSVKL